MVNAPQCCIHLPNDWNVKKVKRWRCVHLVSSWLKAAWSCWSRLSAASSRPWASATSSSLKHKHTLLSILINWIWLVWFIKCPKQWQIMTKWGHYSQTDIKHELSTAYPTPRKWKTIFLLQYNFYTMHFLSSLTRLCIWSWTFCSSLVISSTLAVAVLNSALACLQQEDRLNNSVSTYWNNIDTAIFNYEFKRALCSFEGKIQTQSCNT